MTRKQIQRKEAPAVTISTYEHDYPVTGVKETNELYDSYICRNVSGGGLCRILSIKDRSLFPSLVSWLTDTVDPEAFTDFIEHFNCDGRLCIVMRYTQGLTLEKKLSTESLSLSERLELGRKILERAVLQDIPEYFLGKCFSPGCITVAPDLTVSFNYPIEDIMTSRECTAQVNTVRVLRLLFARETERKVPELLMDFLERLPELAAGSMIDLYSEYYALCTALEGFDAESEQPKTFWFTLWDAIKRVFTKMKTIFILLLLLAALGYLIYTIFDPGKSNKNEPQYDSIGTVKIDQTR